MMAFRFSVLLQLSSCTYVYNYFSENPRIKFIPIDADVSGVVMEPTPNLICYGLVDWLIRYPMTAVVTVVFTSCPTRGGQQRNQFIFFSGTERVKRDLLSSICTPLEYHQPEIGLTTLSE